MFLPFLRYCLDSDSNSCVLEDAHIIDWQELLSWAERQSIVGIIFNGIQKAGKSLDIPSEILFKWIGYANLIEGQNRLLNKRCVELTEYLHQYGFDTCILKGQGNALAYPCALSRTPGDIDVWVRDGRSKREDVRGVVRFAREKNPKAKACYHHVDYGKFKDVEVELHYRPSFMFNPIHNWRLQRWVCKMADVGSLMAELPENAGSIRIPNREFNIVFQLSHVYNHLLHEGIGLRQIVDYYYLLKSDVRGKKEEVAKTLKYLGLEKIAGAMMWVLHEKLGMAEEFLIAPMDERRGKVLLDEIMRGGNFGHYDSDNINATSRLKKNVQRVKRDLRLMRYFPSECIWEPWFRVYHLFWRMAH